MTYSGNGKQYAGSAKRAMGRVRAVPAYLRNFISKSMVIAELEARKLKHDPSDLLTRAVQPVLWLLVFGEVLTQVNAIPTGDLSYLAFMTPGVLAQSVLFISIFYGISIVWERDLGIVQKFLASPTPTHSNRNW